jgi:tripartite ATP-independent transporter DctP family solute receptor
MFRSRTLVCAALVGIVAVVQLAAGRVPAKAAPDVTIKLAIETGPGSPYYVGAQQFAAALKQLDNSMTVQVFPNGQLGAAKDVMQGLKLGTVQMTVTGDSDAIAPESGIFALPFLFGNRKEAYEVLDAPVTKHIFAQTDSQGVHTLGVWDGGFRFVMASKPINSINDLKGMKIRVPPLPIYVDTFKALGTNPTPMAFGQVYTALQQHVVDGVENSGPVLLTSKFDEVAKNLAITHHVFTVAILAIGSTFLNSLTPTQRAHIEQAAAMSTTAERLASAQLERDALQKMQASGVAVTRPDLTPFRDAVKGLYQTYQDKYKTDMSAILSLLKR